MINLKRAVRSDGLVRQLRDDRVGLACPSPDGFESSTAHKTGFHIEAKGSK